MDEYSDETLLPSVGPVCHGTKAPLFLTTFARDSFFFSTVKGKPEKVRHNSSVLEQTLTHAFNRVKSHPFIHFSIFDPPVWGRLV